MTKVAEGKDTQEHVVDHSRALLAGMPDALIGAQGRSGRGHLDAVTADARGGACPVRQGPGHEDERQDPRQLHRLHGLARLRRDLPRPSGVKVSPPRGRGRRVPSAVRLASSASRSAKRPTSNASTPSAPPTTSPISRLGVLRVRRGGPSWRPDRA